VKKKPHVIPALERPGDPPRRVGLDRLFQAMPQALTMGVIVAPAMTIGFGIAHTLRMTDDFRPYLILTSVMTVLLLPIFLFVLRRTRKLLVWGEAVPATVVEVTESDSGPGRRIAKYRYVVEGQEYFDAQVFSSWDPTHGFTVGASVWVVVDRSRPSRSARWS